MITNIRTESTAVLTRPMGYEPYRQWLWDLTKQHPHCQLQTIGTTAGGRSLYAVALGGEGELPAVLYAGGLAASDWLSTALLLRFLAEYSRLLTENGRIYRIHLPHLFARRRILVCPLINGDAAEPCLGEAADGYRNALGADITESFRKGEETHPVEKCPESASLRQYLHWQAPTLFCTLEAGDKSRLVIPLQPSSRAGTTGRLLSRMLQMTPEVCSTGEAAVSSWYGAESGNPVYHVTLEKGEGEDGFHAAYAAVREMLFTAPLLL